MRGDQREALAGKPVALPDGWQPGDHCRCCNTILLAHRLEDLACPDVMACVFPNSAKEHVHVAGCWLQTKFAGPVTCEDCDHPDDQHEHDVCYLCAPNGPCGEDPEGEDDEP
jgi:hypothetical protein